MDRRISKTKYNIMKTFCMLSESLYITEITISNLCEKANISRSTFYQHYTDIYALLEELEKDYIVKLQDLEVVLDSIMDAKEVMVYILQFLQQYQNTLLILYKNKKYTSVFKEINELVRLTFFKKISQNYIIPTSMSEMELDNIIGFVTAGCYKLYIDVIKAEKEIDIEKLSEQISALSDACLTVYLKRKNY